MLCLVIECVPGPGCESCFGSAQLQPILDISPTDVVIKEPEKQAPVGDRGIPGLTFWNKGPSVGVPALQ